MAVLPDDDARCWPRSSRSTPWRAAPPRTSMVGVLVVTDDCRSPDLRPAASYVRDGVSMATPTGTLRQSAAEREAPCWPTAGRLAWWAPICPPSRPRTWTRHWPPYPRPAPRSSPTPKAPAPRCTPPGRPPTSHPNSGSASRCCRTSPRRRGRALDGDVALAFGRTWARLWDLGRAMVAGRRRTHPGRRAASEPRNGEPRDSWLARQADFSRVKPSSGRCLLGCAILAAVLGSRFLRWRLGQLPLSPSSSRRSTWGWRSSSPAPSSRSSSRGPSWQGPLLWPLTSSPLTSRQSTSLPSSPAPSSRGPSRRAPSWPGRPSWRDRLGGRLLCGSHSRDLRQAGQGQFRLLGTGQWHVSHICTRQLNFGTGGLLGLEPLPGLRVAYPPGRTDALLRTSRIR